MGEDPAAGGYTALKGVGRAMAVIEALADGPLRAQALAQRLELSWTTAYRTLAHLEAHEYLRKDATTGEYAIGARLYLLGAAYLVSNRLAAVAPAFLKRASDERRCAAQANERQGAQVITVAAVDPPMPISQTSPGFTFPLGVAAKGRLLLAFAPEEVQRAVLMDASVERWAELTQIRAQGTALANEDVQPGVGSVAAAVRDRHGDVVGCVSLIAGSAELDDADDSAALLATAGDAALACSTALGWSPVLTRRATARYRI